MSAVQRGPWHGTLVRAARHGHEETHKEGSRKDGSLRHSNTLAGAHATVKNRWYDNTSEQTVEIAKQPCGLTTKLTCRGGAGSYEP